MVSQQVTHDSNSSTDWTRESDESVRITAEIPPQVRRQVLIEHYRDEVRKQTQVEAFDSNDLRVLRRNGLPHEEALRRASNSKAVLQRFKENLAAFEGNRDFAQVTR